MFRTHTITQEMATVLGNLRAHGVEVVMVAEGTEGSTDGTGDGSDPAQGDTTDWKAVADKATAEARKWEDRAKKNRDAATALEAERRKGMTEAEQALATARAEARAEVTRTLGGRLVAAEVRAALAGRGDIDAAALLEGIDAARFLTEDGDVDGAAVAKWVARVAPLPAAGDGKPAQAGGFDLGQGVRTGAGAGRQAQGLDSDPLMRDLKAKLNIA